MSALTFIWWKLEDAWWWLTSRVAVEWRRAFPVKHEGRHTQEAVVVQQWADDHAAELEPLPPVVEYDETLAIRDHWCRAAWAATGVTQAQFWAQSAPDRVDELVAVFEATGNLPGQARSMPAPLAGEHDPDCDRSLDAVLICRACANAESARQEPTPNQRAGYWHERAIDVLPEHVIRVLTRAGADDTAIEIDHTTLEPYIVGLAGGDPFDGLGQDEWLDRLFTPVGVR